MCDHHDTCLLPACYAGSVELAADQLQRIHTGHTFWFVAVVVDPVVEKNRRHRVSIIDKNQRIC